MFFKKTLTATEAKAFVTRNEKEKLKQFEVDLSRNSKFLERTFEWIEEKAKQGKKFAGIRFEDGFPENWQEIETYFRKLGYTVDFENNAVWEPAILKIWWI